MHLGTTCLIEQWRHCLNLSKQFSRRTRCPVRNCSFCLFRRDLFGKDHHCATQNAKQHYHQFLCHFIVPFKSFSFIRPPHFSRLRLSTCDRTRIWWMAISLRHIPLKIAFMPVPRLTSRPPNGQSGIKGSDPSVYAFTVYAAGRGVYCNEFSTVTDASQRKPAAIPPTMARASASADLAWGFIA